MMASKQKHSLTFLTWLPLWLVVGLSGCGVVPEQSRMTPDGMMESGQEVAVDSELSDNPLRWGLVKTPPKHPYQSADKSAGNLWDRVKAGYTLVPETSQANFTESIDFYLKYRKHIAKLGKNAEPYLHYIVEALEKRGMPMELALLPAIESAYQPHAYSPAHASGLWQFIPGTAKMFGLKTNHWYDGRKDITASTEAALDYLQTLHQKMDGDWLKAIAAYNCGEGNVFKAIDKNLALGKPTDFWSLDLPRETKQYVPRLMALSTIIEKADRYGVDLEPIDDRPYLTSVDIKGQINLDFAAQLSGVPKSELKRLNPGLKRNTTNPNGSGTLLVPVAQAAHLRQQLAAVPPEKMNPPMSEVVEEEEEIADAAPAKPSVAERKVAERKTVARQAEAQIQTHTIRKGDTLRAIATRYKTNVAVISKINGITQKTRLQPGKTLKIPNTLLAMADNPAKNAPATSSKGGRAADKKAASASNKRGGEILKVSAPSTKKHRVAAGETLWDIAKKHQTDVQVICSLNRINRKAKLNIGDTLQVPATRANKTRKS